MLRKTTGEKLLKTLKEYANFHIASELSMGSTSLFSGSSYYHYKGSHSINLLAISDALNRFLVVDIGAQGRQSDGGVFDNSALPHLFETYLFRIPPPSRMKNSEFEFPYVLL